MQRKNNNKNKKNKVVSKVKGRVKQLMIVAYGPIVYRYCPWGSWKRASLEYVQLFLPTVAGLGVLDQVFRANSLFDPDRTGAGTQPRGFDQFTPLYARYRVLGLGWRIEFAAASIAYPCCAGLVNGTQVFTTITDAGEVLHSPVRVSSSGATSVVYQGYSRLDELQGRSFQAYHTDDLTGAVVTTNPAETIDFHVFVANLTAGAVTPIISCSFWFDSVFFDPDVPGPS